MDKLVQVKLRESGGSFFYKTSIQDLKIGDYVIVEMDRGFDYGHIISGPMPESETKNLKLNPDDGQENQQEAKTSHPEGQVRKIARTASEQDLKHIDDNKARAKEAYRHCVKKIAEYKLDMKLVGCEYSFDRTKIIFYFTSDGRVDFRQLVKDLAKILKARIELRQIGVRDEAKLFGGFGSCGRELCCKAFLRDFEPVMIKMAKEQSLPLNPPKISGLCGRLMCCLSYEYPVYRELLKSLPKEGQTVSISEGKGKVISVNVFKQCLCVEMEDGRQITVDCCKTGK